MSRPRKNRMGRKIPAGPKTASPLRLVPAALFRRLEKEYAAGQPYPLALMDVNGRVLRGRLGGKACARDDVCRQSRQQALHEALRWGESFVSLCPNGCFIWAVPVLQNEALLGGLLASAPATADADANTAAHGIREASHQLQALAEQHNLTNRALLTLHRTESGRQREKAEAIHAVKRFASDSIREVYLREEPALLAAIRRGERGEAVNIINRILVGIYFQGRGRIDLLKSFVLELIVMMSRAAVEAGADPDQLLGERYQALGALSAIRDEEELSEWLTRLLNRVIDGIRSNTRYPNSILLGNALRFMQKNLQRPLTRDETARAAGLSASHFSHLMTGKIGKSFTDLLTQYRIERASQLLLRTEQNMLQVALDCGFADQSYFTKVFRRITGETPLAYRQRRQRAGKL